jgi:hypothetical protein
MLGSLWPQSLKTTRDPWGRKPDLIPTKMNSQADKTSDLRENGM